MSLFCFSVNVVSEKTETKLRGQSSAAKWGIIKKGWKKVKTTVKKVAKHVKKKANKVKIVFQERVLGKMRTIKDKFVLASAGGGSRAFFGFAGFIEGYKNGLSDILKDTEFIASNSGSSWLMNRVLMEGGYPESGQNKWVEKVHDEMSGYELREKKMNKLKDKYAKEKFDFKVGQDVYVFRDGIQCLGTLKKQTFLDGRGIERKNKEKILKAKRKTFEKLEPVINKHFGSKHKFEAFIKKKRRNCHAPKSAEVIVQIKCGRQAHVDDAMPDSQCKCETLQLHRLNMFHKEVIHFDKQTKKPVRLLPAILDQDEQRLMVSELLQMGVFASWFKQLSMVGLLFNFLNAHVLEILDSDHRTWRDFVRISAMRGLKRRNNRKVMWRQMVAVGTSGSYYDNNVLVNTYEIQCKGIKKPLPKLVSVYITVENGDNPIIKVDVPYFKNRNNCVFRYRELKYKREQLKFEHLLNPNIKKEQQCFVPVTDDTKIAREIPFSGNDLIKVIKEDFTQLWKNEPYFMSSASSNFPGLAASEKLLDGIDFFKFKNAKHNIINQWSRNMLLGLVNAFGNEMKDRIFKPRKGERYHLNMPNPNLVENAREQVPNSQQQTASSSSSSRGLNFNLLDGGYIDNTGVSLSLHYMLKKYKSNKMPKLISLLHSSTFEGNMDEIKKFFDHDGGFMEFDECQIFKGKFNQKGFEKTCDKARDHKEPYCYYEVKATTIKHENHGIPAGRKVKILFIIPLAFEGLPVLSLENSKESFKSSFKVLKKVDAIENAVFKRKEKRSFFLIKWVKNLFNKGHNIISGISNIFKIASNTRGGLKKYTSGGLGMLIKKILRVYKWTKKFKKGNCNYKYQNDQIYKDTIGFLIELKNSIGKHDDENYAQNGVNNAQDLYTQYLEHEKKEAKRNKNSNFAKRFADVGHFLEVALAKIIRFFPTFQNYVNVCGFKGTNRGRCKFYKIAGGNLITPFVEGGYLQAIVDLVNAMLKEGKNLKPSWWQVIQKVKNHYHPINRIIGMLDRFSNDLKNKKCQKDIIKGMTTIFDKLIVDLPFEYAAAKTDVDKFNLETDAANFFTSTYKDVEQETFFMRKIFREMTRTISKNLADGTIDFQQTGSGSGSGSGSGKKTRMKKKRHNKLLYKNRFYRNRYKKKYRPSMMQQKRSK